MSWLNVTYKWIYTNLYKQYKQSKRDAKPSYQNMPTNSNTMMLLYINLTKAGDNKYTLLVVSCDGLTHDIAVFWLIKMMKLSLVELNYIQGLEDCVKIGKSGLGGSKINIKIN